jgi:hypothetical protein
MGERLNHNEAEWKAPSADELIRQFGDPNREDFRDPYGELEDSADVVGHGASRPDVWELAEGDPRLAAAYALGQERGVPTSPKFRDVRPFDGRLE